MKILSSEHVGEEALEKYSMGRTSEPEAEPIEEHILICAGCQDRLEAMDEFLLTMREAARLSATSAPRRRRPWFGWPVFATGWKPALAAGAMAAALVLAILPSRSGLPALETVALVSARGVDPAGAAVAQAGRRLALSIDLRALEPMEAYRVDLVDSRGRPVWSSIARGEGESLQVVTGLSPARGRYWVRLYAPRMRQELVREFGLVVQ